ncbi:MULTISPECIES: hypothetical protein [unclassified Streptomyces]|uniref:hypothetical protein n=1 Tax=unclassified Streptomyces TaxID=2593676 RepID=UPI00224D3328|nr:MULTISPECIES: hypothetical protein [unclassified Streptomyces]MCX4885823.1 hypothetical protein [Streptomyces sp. NBC_00847]MCX5425698.1 hypothetical protein [Streptomyces sp. NBC_00078]
MATVRFPEERVPSGLSEDRDVCVPEHIGGEGFGGGGRGGCLEGQVNGAGGKAAEADLHLVGAGFGDVCERDVPEAGRHRPAADHRGAGPALSDEYDN